MAPSNRRVVVLAYDGLCTFEFALAVEIFALKRPELRVPWYDFAVCAVERGPGAALARARGNGGGCPAGATSTARRPGRWLRRSGGRTRAARDSCPSARARSFSPPPDCSTESERRRTGATPRASPSASPASNSCPMCSTSTRASSSPRQGAPRGSTSACTSCAATTAPRWPIRWRDAPAIPAIVSRRLATRRSRPQIGSLKPRAESAFISS